MDTLPGARDGVPLLASQREPAATSDGRAPHPGAPLDDQHTPSGLLRLFRGLSIASVALILVLSGFGVYRLYSNERILDAERAAVAVGQAIVEQERGVLIDKDAEGRTRVAVAPAEYAGLDVRMRKYLRPFRIVKIKVFSADGTIVYSTDTLIVGMADKNNARLERVLRGGGVTSSLASKDRVLDVAGEERFDVDVVETYLPILVGDAITGGIEVYVDVTQARERIVAGLTLSLAVLCSVLLVVFAGLYFLMHKEALLLTQAQDELRGLAFVDTLTGIFNRRYVMARAHEEHSRALRLSAKGDTPRGVGFVMADFDHFKRINDEFGHPAGDEVLRAAAARLRSVTRAYDVVGRYGGEEFLVLLPNTSLDETKQAAEHMRHSIGASPISAGGRALAVTVSLGVACSETGDADAAAAIARADKALYKAKAEGRNRVAWL